MTAWLSRWIRFAVESASSLVKAWSASYQRCRPPAVRAGCHLFLTMNVGPTCPLFDTLAGTQVTNFANHKGPTLRVFYSEHWGEGDLARLSLGSPPVCFPVPDSMPRG